MFLYNDQKTKVGKHRPIIVTIKSGAVRDNLEKVIIQGPIQETCKRGRPKLRWTDGIKEMSGLCLNTAHQLSQNIDRWQSIIKGIKESVIIHRTMMTTVKM